MPDLRSEQERIKEVYRKRDAAGLASLYSPDNPSALFCERQRLRALINMLQCQGLGDKSELRVLDVGCGTGGMLREFDSLGFNADNLVGVDLLPDRIERARATSPDIEFIEADASRLPFEDNSMDIVLQFTLFSSILDDDLRQSVAREIIRVLVSGGLIVWYDFFISKPGNTDTRGIRKKELRELFDGFDIEVRKITLAPPIARMLAGRAKSVCLILESLKLMNTHYLAAIRERS